MLSLIAQSGASANWNLLFPCPVRIDSVMSGESERLSGRVCIDCLPTIFFYYYYRPTQPSTYSFQFYTVTESLPYIHMEPHHLINYTQSLKGG